MGEAAFFALGVFIGLIIYWVVYRMYWHRWRKIQEQDVAYLRAKVESAQFTSMGLERQLNAQKTEIAEQHGKITGMERENWQAQMRLQELTAEKQALVMHMDALRAELAGYKKAASTPELPAQAQHGNGKTHQPPAISHPLKPERETDIASRAAEEKKEALNKTPSNGKTHAYLPIEQVTEPVLLIARPRMGGDRLEIIQGIGPAIVKKLNRAGIDTFQALSQVTPERLKEIVGVRAARLMDADSVISQARKLVGERRARNTSG